MRLDGVARFHPERKAELYQVSRGDVLVVARGQDHRAHHVVDDLSDTLASSSFYILRPRGGLVLPGYLAWWLNLPRVQAEIDAGSRATTIGYISRQTLERLTVPVPPIEVQHRIERVVALWRERRSLRSRIDEKRAQYTQAVCRQAVRRAKE
jgi:restriction endonuclease S subunit